MAKLTLSNVANISGAESAAIGVINANSDAIETALENTLSRNGTSPNSMSSDLDMGNNDVLNVGYLDADTLTLGGEPVVIGESGASLLTSADVVLTHADVVSTKAAAEQAAADVVLADSAKAAAEAARDSAFANAKGDTTIAAARALVADNETFIVYTSGAETFSAYRRLTSTTETLLGEYPSALSVSLVKAHIVDPFPETDFNECVILKNVEAPASGITSTNTEYTVANAGRFYAAPSIASFGLAIGDTVRVAFKQTAGSSRPASFTFRAALTLVDTVNFVLLGGWYVAEAVIPATTTIIRLDFTNSSGADVSFLRPRFAKKISTLDMPNPVVERMNALNADAGDLPNLWPGVTAVDRAQGAGDPLDVVISDDTVTIPADFLAVIRPVSGSIPRPNGSVITILVKTDSVLLKTGINARLNGVGGASTTQVAMKHIGDGWWILQGYTLAMADPLGMKELQIEPDNRTAAAVDGYTTAPVTIGPIYVFDGADIPSRRPAPAQTLFADDELVLTQTAGAIQIAQRAGEPQRHIQWTFTRYSDVPTRSIGWRISGLALATRNSATSISPSTAIIDTGETEIAIKEVGKTDFMGGAIHGDMEETRAIQVFVDGQQITPDGATTIRARKIEFIQSSELLEVDNVTRTVSATVVTRWTFERGLMRLSHRLTWARSMNLSAGYLTMLPILRPMSDTAFREPDYDPIDISSSGHAMAYTNGSRIFTVGGNVRADVEVLNGWTSDCSSFVEDDAVPDRNKIYFSLCPLGGSFAVVSGQSIDWEAEYRISVSE